MSPEVIEHLPPRSLVVVPQVRKQFCEADEAGLMQSLREVGILSPILARLENGKQVIVDGHRRTAAAIKLGMATVPVIVERAALSTSATVQRQLVANCQRSDLTPIEKAVAIHQLMEAEGWSASQVATKLGFSAASVTRLLSLLALPEAVRNQVAAGEIPASAAYELARVDDPQRQTKLATQLAAGALTRDAVSGAAKAHKKGRANQEPKTAARVVAALDRQRTMIFCGPGVSLDALIGWCEELLGKARRARTQGLHLETFLKMLRDQAQVR